MSRHYLWIVVAMIVGGIAPPAFAHGMGASPSMPNTATYRPPSQTYAPSSGYSPSPGYSPSAIYNPDASAMAAKMGMDALQNSLNTPSPYPPPSPSYPPPMPPADPSPVTSAPAYSPPAGSGDNPDAQAPARTVNVDNRVEPGSGHTVRTTTVTETDPDTDDRIVTETTRDMTTGKLVSRTTNTYGKYGGTSSTSMDRGGSTTYNSPDNSHTVVSTTPTQSARELRKQALQQLGIDK